jgi:hypothetical protein
MLAQYPIQSGSLRSIRRGRHVLAGSMAAVLIITILSIMIGLEVSAATVRSTLSEQSSEQIVNRTRKGDRQLAVHEVRQIKFEHTPAPDLKSVDGCESLVSPLANAPLAKVAGRCVS